MNKLEDKNQNSERERGGGWKGETRKLAALIPVREPVSAWPSATLGAGWE
jgi:hypothetical protein